MAKYVKKPIVVEATQWYQNGDHPEDYTKTRQGFNQGNLDEFSGEYARAQGWEGDVVRYYRNPQDSGERLCEHCNVRMHEHGWIDTLESGHVVCPGDYIITGIQGERYPCKPNIFIATYDAL